MILIGEKLNSSIPKTLELYKSKNQEELINIIKAQKEADYLDINTGLCENEIDMMKYVIELCQDNSRAKIMPDSSNPNVLKEVCKYIKGDFIINSVTAKERLEEIIPIVKEYDCGVVALPIVDTVPSDPEERLNNAKIIIDRFEKENISIDKIYFDILVEPLATNIESGNIIMNTLKLFKENNLKTTCGLSNVSFGLPKRKDINSMFLSNLMTLGLDSAICDVMCDEIVKSVKITNMLNGNDEYCMKYIKFVKKNKN